MIHNVALNTDSVVGIIESIVWLDFRYGLMSCIPTNDSVDVFEFADEVVEQFCKLNDEDIEYIANDLPLHLIEVDIPRFIQYHRFDIEELKHKANEILAKLRIAAAQYYSTAMSLN